MSRATVSVLPLTAADHSLLSTLAQARTAPRHHAERAGIVLQLATGRSVREAATRLALSRQRVRRCARRAAAVGAVRALDDLPRSGRPRQITPAARLWLVGQACAQPKALGYPHELWTLRLLAGHARRLGPAAGHPCLATLVPSTVRTILQEQEVRPHKVRYYLERRDPAFDERLAAVVEVYQAVQQLQDVAPEAHRVAILSYDEKPGLQAIAPTAPDRPPQRGRHPTVQRDHEYKRLGTVTLSAAVDLVSGVVHHALTQRHRSCEFVAFLRRLDASYPAEWRIRLLLDNHSAHRSRETHRFLDSCPGRFELVFTPKHASWLNYVETFFSKMARSVLRHIRVVSRQELCERITAFIHACNDAPAVPKWSYGLNTPDACVAT
jgi:transposase